MFALIISEICFLVPFLLMFIYRNDIHESPVWLIYVVCILFSTVVTLAGVGFARALAKMLKPKF